MNQAYWLIGKTIVEEEQGGEERAAYGEKLIKDLAHRMTHAFGGYSTSVLKRIRQFYLTYPKGATMWRLSKKGVAALSPKSATTRHLSKLSELYDLIEFDNDSLNFSP